MLTKDFWQNRYNDQQTGWDAEGITTPIKEYFDKVSDKSTKILIPGCGNAHEATYLFGQGFANLYLCDWAQAPLENFANKNPGFPRDKLICANFFDLEQQDFDFVIEQTFFCALNPEFRPQYALKMSEIIKTGGKLVGLMFNEALDLEREGPPFGGNKEEYMAYFTPYFSQVSIIPCQNSIKPRKGVELFIEIEK